MLVLVVVLSRWNYDNNGNTSNIMIWEYRDIAIVNNNDNDDGNYVKDGGIKY